MENKMNRIPPKAELHSAIKKNCPTAKFIPSEYYKGYDILINKDKQFVKIEYCLMKHRRRIVDDRLVETMSLVVRDMNNSENRFYNKTLNIDEKYFMHLVNSPVSDKNKNIKLLDIAKSVMPTI